MIEQLINGLEQWKLKTGERQKLQHIYVVIAVGALIVAGLIGLIDNELGQTISYVALASIIVFIVNGIVWHLVVDNLLDRIKDTKN